MNRHHWTKPQAVEVSLIQVTINVDQEDYNACLNCTGLYDIKISSTPDHYFKQNK